jgi:ribosome-binding protein aMBF1 (putative translation factor)
MDRVDPMLPEAQRDQLLAQLLDQLRTDDKPPAKQIRTWIRTGPGGRFRRPGLEPRLASKLRLARKEARLTLAELADRIGCSVSFLSLVETSRRLPSEETLHELAIELSLSDDLVDRIEDQIYQS